MAHHTQYTPNIEPNCAIMSELPYRIICVQDEYTRRKAASEIQYNYHVHDHA